MNMKADIFDHLGSQFGQLSQEQMERIKYWLSQTLQYEPRVGILGKTGVGKSSLCNALFGKDIAPVSDVESCTREAQEIPLRIGQSNIHLIDLPGAGESRERDIEYKKLYAKHLPNLDLVLWVLKADDKAFSSDEEFYYNVVKPYLNQGKPFIIVLNQVDKVEPFRQWDIENCQPGLQQQENIRQKRQVVADRFKINKNAVVAVSAQEQYNLITLVETITYALPKDKKVTFVNALKDENRSESAREEAKRVFLRQSERR